MVHMGVNKEILEFIKEASRQGFEVEHRGATTYACKPPNKDLPIVNVAAHDNTNVRVALQQLRRAGLVWPPLKKGLDHHKQEWEDAIDASAEFVEPPKRAKSLSLGLVVATQDVEVTVTEATPDRLYQELKEEREYVRIARDHAQDCMGKLRAAEHAEDRATEELKKAEFDRCFSAA